MKNSIARFTGTIYPDKTFSVGYIPRAVKSSADKEYDRNWENQYDEYSLIQESYRGCEYKSVRFFRGILNCVLFIECPKSSQPREKYGRHGITAYGRKVVRCISTIAQNELQKERLGFGTCTLPNYSDEILRALSSSWGEVVRRFFQAYKRSCKRKGCPYDYVSVTEIQEKRYERSKIPVLHIHFLYQCRRNIRNSAFFHCAEEFRGFWQQAVESVIRKLGLHPCNEISYLASTHIQVVRKSAAGYLGKYLTKGGAATAKVIESGDAELLPSQWWSASMQWKKKFKDSLIKLDAKTAQAFFYGLEEYLHEGVFTWARYVEVEIDGEYRKMGCHGVLSDNMFACLSSP
jgi:hypothetical protein